MMIFLTGTAFAECLDETVSYWELNENTGSTAGDTISSNDGSITGSTWTTGKVSNALSFDGSNDYVDLGNDTSLQITGDITIMAWIKTEDLATYRPIVDDNGGDNFTSYSLWVNDAGKLIWWSDGSGWKASNGSVEDDSWHHVAVTLSGTTLKFYIDGEEDANSYTVSSLTATSDRKTIGLRSDVQSYLFNGEIDEVAIYDDNLTANQIEDAYNKGVSERNYCFTNPVIDYTNIAMTNESNTFTEWQTINMTTEAKMYVESETAQSKLVFISPTDQESSIWFSNNDNFDHPYNPKFQGISWGIRSLPNSQDFTLVNENFSSAFTITQNKKATFNGDFQISGLTNCDTIDTDAQGNLICGTDESGDSGMDYTNIAMTNESNTFVADQEFSTSLRINASNCNTLDTDENGLIICGNDELGEGGMDYTNIAMQNESNTFLEEQTFQKAIRINATSCNSLDTDAQGNLICGTDETGTGGEMDYTNIAMVNESNSFIEENYFQNKVNFNDEVNFVDQVEYFDPSYFNDQMYLTYGKSFFLGCNRWQCFSDIYLDYGRWEDSNNMIRFMGDENLTTVFSNKGFALPVGEPIRLDATFQNAGGNVNITYDSINDEISLTKGIKLGDSSTQKNITMYSPDGSEWTCGVDNNGVFSCT